FTRAPRRRYRRVTFAVSARNSTYPSRRGSLEALEANVWPLAPTAQTARATTSTIAEVFSLSKQAKHVSAVRRVLGVSSSESRSPTALNISVAVSALNAPQLMIRSAGAHSATAQSAEPGSTLRAPSTNASCSVTGSPLGPCGPGGPGAPGGPGGNSAWTQ